MIERELHVSLSEFLWKSERVLSFLFKTVFRQL